MRRDLLVIVFTLIFVVFGNTQNAKLQQVQPTESFTEKQETLADIFLESLLKYVDKKTRQDFAEDFDPVCLPQRPTIKFSYRGKQISSDQFKWFKSTARKIAPSVQLAGPEDTTSGAYTIDILEIVEGDPLNSVKYRHSKDLTFPSRESQPWFGQPRIETISRDVNDFTTSEALIPNDIYSTITLSLGHFTEDILKEKAVDVKDKSVLENIGKAIASLHAKAGDQVPQKTQFLPYYSATAQKFNDQLDDKNVKVVFAERSLSSGFVGTNYTYLLVKKRNEWEVIDARVISFSDVTSVWPCDAN